MKRLIWLLPVLMAMFLEGCLKDDGQGTIVLMGTESDVKPIEDVIPDTLLTFIGNANAMDSVGAVDLPLDLTPPDIQGEYAFFPIELCADNGHGVPRNDTLYFRFGGDSQLVDTILYYPNGQHNRKVTCDFYGDVLEKGNVYKKHQTEAFVMGDGRDGSFASYFTIDYDCESLGAFYQLKRGYVIKGKVSSSGIEQAVIACVNDSIVVLFPGQNFALPQKDCIYVYRVKAGDNQFGTAPRFNWYSDF